MFVRTVNLHKCGQAYVVVRSMLLTATSSSCSPNFEPIEHNLIVRPTISSKFQLCNCLADKFASDPYYELRTFAVRDITTRAKIIAYTFFNTHNIRSLLAAFM